MSVAAVYPADRAKRRAPALWPNLDHRLLAVLTCIAGVGLVMVASASVSIADKQFADPFFYVKRQAVYFAIGLAAAYCVLKIRLESWQRSSTLLLVFAYFLLLAVLVPGVGREVNGATRWIPLGLVNLQVSEVTKLLIFLYLSAYLVRRAEAVRSAFSAFLVPMTVMLFAAFLLLLEPDFGAAVVMVVTGMGMLFLAGMPVWRFGVLGGLVGAAAALLIVTSPYRWARLTGFLNPWADPFNSGFQLTQSLIAIGRGQWFGVGLGSSVQKLLYLPEAHTDFLFAVLAEEFGLIGVLLLIALYGYVVWRACVIGTRSLKLGLGFGGYLAYGIGLWFGMQAFVNMGVNMGILPTKGLTLPLMSYGGSSLISSLVALALLMRADHELRIESVGAQPMRRRV
jgi:cell division protein FtsW